MTGDGLTNQVMSRLGRPQIANPTRWLEVFPEAGGGRDYLLRGESVNLEDLVNMVCDGTVEPWMDDYALYLVEKYFGRCGLVEDACKELRNLPRGLMARLGRNEAFWRQYLSREDAAPRRLNLIWGAVEKVGEQALANEKRHGKSLCYYLMKALEEEQMTEWIAGFLRGMVFSES